MVMHYSRYTAAIFLVTLIIFGSSIQTARTATVAERTAGRILLQVERNGEAWYVYPKTLTRFYLGRPKDAFDVMRFQGLGITNANLAKIPVAGSSDSGDQALRDRLAGYILLQVERNGEAWYVYPVTKQRYFLGYPEDAWNLMRNLGLGISNSDLAQIPVDNGVRVEHQGVVSSRGTYTVDYLTFDRKNPELKITTDTGNDGNCASNCTVLSLGSYVTRRNALAGIHGTYFCPADYSSCSSEVNHYFFPVFNSYSRVFINGDRIKYTAEPMVAFDSSNHPFFFRQTKQFTSEQDFYNDFANVSIAAGGNGQLRAAISNGPALIDNGQNVVGQYALDSKQSSVKSYRGALGWKGDTIYLLVVSGATVTDSAAVMEALGLDYAINLDGGGSTALYQAGRYIIGPGRNLPNAVLLSQ